MYRFHSSLDWLPKLTNDNPRITLTGADENLVNNIKP